MTTTLRSSISDTVNTLNKLLLQTHTPEAEARLRKLRRIYFALWEEVIEQEIDHQTSEFSDALEALSQADHALEAARSDMSKVNDAINHATVAAQAVDRIVKLGLDLFA